MDCAGCGHTNPADAKFCQQCGARLARECAACGAELPGSARFCHACGTPVADAPTSAPAPPAQHPTSFCDGRYEVQRFLGEGGKKRVYLAHDTKLDRDVAFALIKTEGLDAEGHARIRREAQAMGRLGDHPHVVSVFDMGEEDGQPYLVSQLVGFPGRRPARSRRPGSPGG